MTVGVEQDMPVGALVLVSLTEMLCCGHVVAFIRVPRARVLSKLAAGSVVVVVDGCMSGVGMPVVIVDGMV